MESQTKMTFSQPGDEITMHPEGDITASSVSELRSQMKTLITDNIKKLTIDLSEVKVIDSSGIGLLVAAHNSLNRQGGSLQVIHASTELLSLFKAFRLDRHFAISVDTE